jgi:hypothetical protein
VPLFVFTAPVRTKFGQRLTLHPHSNSFTANRAPGERRSRTKGETLRGLSFVALLSCLVLSIYSNADTNQKTFVESCLDSTGILNKQFVCEVNLGDKNSVLRFVLNQGEQISVTSRGQFGNLTKELAVFKITHLPPRITDLGVMGESVELCQQSAYAAMGVSKMVGAQERPDQMVAHCELQ